MIGKCSFMFFLFSAFRIPEARCKTATMLPPAIQKFGKSMIHLKADGHLALSPLLPLPHLPEQNTPLSLSLSLPLGLYCHQILNSEFLKEMQINAVIWWCYLRLLFCCFACGNAFVIFLHLCATAPRSSKNFQGQWEVLPSEKEKTAWSDPRNISQLDLQHLHFCSVGIILQTGNRNQACDVMRLQTVQRRR